MPYDLNLLEQAEKDQLLQELLSKYGNETTTQRLGQSEVPGGAMPHGDEEADKAMLEPFAKVLDVVIDKLEELEERIMANEKLVIDDLFGGIDRMYKQNLRTKSVDGLRNKYGPMFEPHMPALAELAPGEDIYEALHDMLDHLRQGGDFDDEKELGAVKSVAEAIAEKIAKIKGPVAGSVEVTAATPIEGGAEDKPAEPAEKEDPQAAFLKKVQGMKDKAKAKGL